MFRNLTSRSARFASEQFSTRHASSKAKASKASKKQPHATASLRRTSDRTPTPASPSVLASDASRVTKAPASTAIQSGSEGRIVERLIYTNEGYHLGNDPRLLLGFGLMSFIFCLNAADIVRRPGLQPSDPTLPRIEGWPAWKRWGMALGLVSAGSGTAAIALWWPTKIVKRISLLARPGITLPSPSHFSQSGRYTTPYHQCDVSIVSAASAFLPMFYKPKTIPFNSLRLLGPLSKTQKWYHPESSAFESSRRKGGILPSHVPMSVVKEGGKKSSLSISRADGTFVDLEGLEMALLENGKGLV